MPFKAHFLNVGCADCTILELGKHIVMIDCGYKKRSDSDSGYNNILGYLIRNIGRSRIDLLIITHPHRDHFSGLKELFKRQPRIRIGEFWESPYKRRREDNSLPLDEWKEYRDLRDWYIARSKTHTVYSNSSDSFKDLSGCKLQILGPNIEVNENEGRNCHDASLVVWISTFNYNLIFCGDASNSELDEVMVDWDISKCNILHASHHGSDEGANVRFIQMASPRLTIVSTEEDIHQNLPSQDALGLYAQYSEHVWRTDEQGSAIVIDL